MMKPSSNINENRECPPRQYMKTDNKPFEMNSNCVEKNIAKEVSSKSHIPLSCANKTNENVIEMPRSSTSYTIEENVLSSKGTKRKIDLSISKLSLPSSSREQICLEGNAENKRKLSAKRIANENLVVHSNTKGETKDADLTKNEGIGEGKFERYIEGFSTNVGRRGDDRMNRAVSIRLAYPEISLLDALTAGGFKFSPPKLGSGKPDKRTYDSDNVLLCQRKNQLSRRLRLAKKKSGKQVSIDLKNNVRQESNDTVVDGRSFPKEVPRMAELQSTTSKQKFFSKLESSSSQDQVSNSMEENAHRSNLDKIILSTFETISGIPSNEDSSVNIGTKMYDDKTSLNDLLELTNNLRRQTNLFPLLDPVQSRILQIQSHLSNLQGQSQQDTDLDPYANTKSAFSKIPIVGDDLSRRFMASSMDTESDQMHSILFPNDALRAQNSAFQVNIPEVTNFLDDKRLELAIEYYKVARLVLMKNCILRAGFGPSDIQEQSIVFLCFKKLFPCIK
mmetsp:Transcript_12071/g.17163  ORF Transcript_12071/g.17163 Transcript_12071/m.17163 type:complete len:506 (-) Transcript_12071:62-1579(-)